MKNRYIIFIFSYFFLFTYAHEEKIHTSRGFLYYRPAYYNINARTSIWSHIMQQEEPANSLGLQAFFVYQESQNTNNIARYFLLNCQNNLLFAGDSSPQRNYRDVRAEWLKLPHDFAAHLSLSPFQKQYALVFNYRKDLNQLDSWEILEPCWLELSMPIQHVKNRLNPKQYLPEGNQIINALDNQNMGFSKIYRGSQEITDIAEITLTLGYRWLVLDGFLLSTYSSVIIPTGSKHNPEYLFSPYTGPDGFFGVGTGVRLEMPLFDTPVIGRDIPQFFNTLNCCDIKAYFFFDIENQYFLPDDRLRTFDLNHKQWSRYLQYRKPEDRGTISGVNILTVHTWVEPHNMIDLTGGFLITYGNFHTEFGYSLWARQKETLHLIKPSCEDRKFKFSCYGIAGSVPGASANNSTICYRAPDDENFLFIQPRDINLCSAAYSGGAAHRAHGFLGYQRIAPFNEIFGGLGAFYEFYETNSALSNWGLWGKIGAIF